MRIKSRPQTEREAQYYYEAQDRGAIKVYGKQKLPDGKVIVEYEIL